MIIAYALVISMMTVDPTEFLHKPEVQIATRETIFDTLKDCQKEEARVNAISPGVAANKMTAMCLPVNKPKKESLISSSPTFDTGVRFTGCFHYRIRITCPQ